MSWENNIQEGSFCSSPSFQKPKAAKFFEEYSLQFVSANIRCDPCCHSCSRHLAHNRVGHVLARHHGQQKLQCMELLTEVLQEGFRSVKWGRWFSDEEWLARWWFQIFFIFTPTCGNDPIWLIFFKWGWNHQLVSLYNIKLQKFDLICCCFNCVSYNLVINLKGIIYT